MLNETFKLEKTDLGHYVVVSSGRLQKKTFRNRGSFVLFKKQFAQPFCEGLKVSLGRKVPGMRRHLKNFSPFSSLWRVLRLPASFFVKGISSSVFFMFRFLSC